MTLGDPLAVSPCVWPTPGVVAWAIDGMGQAGSSGPTTVAPGCDPSITATATSTCVGGVMIGYITPAIVGATSTVDSPICPIIGSGIAAIAGCSATFEGAL